MRLSKGWMIILAIPLVVYISGIAIAQDETTSDPTTQESPGFSNPASAQHAENLAEASASKAQAELADAQADVAEAEAALNAAIGTDDEAEAQAHYDAACAALETAIANATGVTAEEISDMRSSGMGWGEIAHELGIHPGTLGLGHTKEKHSTEMEMATVRNAKTGLSAGHGTKTGGKGIGLNKAEGKKGVGKGVDGKGGGNAGGNGKGNSGGNGGGKDK